MTPSTKSAYTETQPPIVSHGVAHIMNHCPTLTLIRAHHNINTHKTCGVPQLTVCFSSGEQDSARQVRATQQQLKCIHCPWDKCLITQNTQYINMYKKGWKQRQYDHIPKNIKLLNTFSPAPDVHGSWSNALEWSAESPLVLWWLQEPWIMS